MKDIRIYANNAKSVLATSISATTTSITLTDASSFPIPSSGEFFLLTVDNGSSVEIIRVEGVNGNVLTPCVRAQEGTKALVFSAGTKAENRATAETFESFTRFSDVMSPIDSLESLVPPSLSDSETYVCADFDESNNPIVAVQRDLISWRFVNHPQVKLSGKVTGTPSSLSVNFETASSILGGFTKGAYILQFTSGLAAGYPRFVTLADQAKIYWTTALPYSPSIGDTYEVYRSSSSLFNELEDATLNSILFAIVLGDS